MTFSIAFRAISTGVVRSVSLKTLLLGTCLSTTLRVAVVAAPLPDFVDVANTEAITSMLLVPEAYVAEYGAQKAIQDANYYVRVRAAGRADNIALASILKGVARLSPGSSLRWPSQAVKEFTAAIELAGVKQEVVDFATVYRGEAHASTERHRSLSTISPA